ncbi:MAG: hypothetical protein E7319_08870 [Clostridiales bacterium]|nr:hypothetical protein [Clostridiales bacterium]
MLREGLFHGDPSEMTMTVLREKQVEACERRLLARPGVALFSDEATNADAQGLLAGSFDDTNGLSSRRLLSIQELRAAVLTRLPLEAQYIDPYERQLLERLIVNHGELVMGDWDDMSAAEALIRRLWCGFRVEDDRWTLVLPERLMEPLLRVYDTPQAVMARDRLFRYDATINGLLYIAGLLHAAQPISFFLNDVICSNDWMAQDVARRYLQASFDYVTDGSGGLILLHPGLVDPYRLVRSQSNLGGTMGALELTQETIAGGMNGILPEEKMLHEKMCAALEGALRPEYDLVESAEDLRMLAKQGISLEEMQAVMASLLAVMPTPEMNNALKQLYLGTPRWLGLKAAQVH